MKSLKETIYNFMDYKNKSVKNDILVKKSISHFF